MNYNAVIFDLDGTLVNSIADLAYSMNSVLQENNMPVHDVNSYYGFVGKGLKSLVENALPQAYRDDETISELTKSLKELYAKNITRKTEPYEGIRNMLDILTSKGVKISVLSNKADELTKKVVSEIFSDFIFEFVMGPDDEDMRKPNPENAIKIAKALNLKPEKVVFVGDTSIDIQTGKNAGMKTVGVAWGFRRSKELIDAGADYIIDHPSQLIGIIFNDINK